ncbi:MAG: nucleotide exchange factor GrpE [Candidatus Woykebacteria bacterium RBG_13_40_7b]|uniref:Protein GrpE n=1 Tax=Candidatus Woykebacteria bacterium RBG_13_40_7b TaxID=1802594 RepID=A0A1G1WBH1_9BACT|nr:MAG: nucleotide exchange factor GrpE [Candidatus Woykebacteria bacterium RBG_13_40_7b]
MVKKKEKSEDKVGSLQNQLKRALADYSNLEKRVEEEKESFVKLANATLVLKILPILDSLEKANQSLKDQGLDLIIREFKNILASVGVEEIKAEAEDFNPQYHEAIEVVQGEKDNQVVAVLEGGYLIGGKVLRPAKVRISKKELEKESDKVVK